MNKEGGKEEKRRRNGKKFIIPCNPFSHFPSLNRPVGADEPTANNHRRRTKSREKESGNGKWKTHLIIFLDFQVDG
jgi:hypothetical protein